MKKSKWIEFVEWGVLFGLLLFVVSIVALREEITAPLSEPGIEALESGDTY
jgi:hypothetical protein